MSSVSVKELIQQAGGGDEVAFQALLRQSLDPLLAVITPRIPADLRSVVAADDVCQETYVAAVRARATFQDQGEGSFFRWLLSIADRKLTDAIRAHRAQKRGGGRRVDHAQSPEASAVVALLDLVAVHSRTPSRSAARHEAVGAVQVAVAALKDDYAEVVRLRHLQGLSVEETARQMGRTPGAIMKLCARAIEQLAERIGDPDGLLSQSG